MFLIFPTFFRGLPFIPFIDSLPSMNRKLDGPFIMPIVDKYKDMGTVVMGKVESGECRKGQNLVIMPNRVNALTAQPNTVSCNLFYIFVDASNCRSVMVGR